jgi:hypothetical protein
MTMAKTSPQLRGLTSWFRRDPEKSTSSGVSAKNRVTVLPIVNAVARNSEHSSELLLPAGALVGAPAGDSARLVRRMLDSALRGGQSERTMPLTERDRKILDLEGSWWTSVCSKGSQIRDLGLSRSQYYSVLRRLVHSADALDHSPLVVRRLRRQQLDRRRDRFEGHAAQPHRPRR